MYKTLLIVTDYDAGQVFADEDSDYYLEIGELY